VWAGLRSLRELPKRDERLFDIERTDKCSVTNT
jgi:hypothetical protein